MAASVQERFEDFHKTNPHVYVLFDRFAKEMLRRGFKNGSAQLIYERIRWEANIVTDSDDNLKLNDNYRSRYSRLWEELNPEHAGFFRKRKITR